VLYLLAAVGLEFAGTLGAAVVVFQHVGGQPGVAFTLPLVLFLFVVAIGTDYNMLMSDRLSEEFASGATPRKPWPPQSAMPHPRSRPPDWCSPHRSDR
jgi:putative drug exporter of the RND superfamily